MENRCDINLDGCDGETRQNQTTGESDCDNRERAVPSKSLRHKKPGNPGIPGHKGAFKVLSHGSVEHRELAIRSF